MTESLNIDIDQDYFNSLTSQLAHRLLPTGKLKEFTGQNSVLIGGHAEAVIREYIANTIFPIRLSTGAVIFPGKAREETSTQIDAICWSPNPFPAVFEAENFALVPRMSSLGILEIKSSTYSGVGKDIKKVLDMEIELTAGPSDPVRRKRCAAMGVIVRQSKKISDSTLTKLISEGRAVVLIEERDGIEIINTKAVCKLVNFLSGIRWRWQNLDGQTIIRDDLLK